MVVFVANQTETLCVPDRVFPPTKGLPHANMLGQSTRYPEATEILQKGFLIHQALLEPSLLGRTCRMQRKTGVTFHRRPCMKRVMDPPRQT